MQPGTATAPVDWTAVLAAGLAFWAVFVLGQTTLDRVLASGKDPEARREPALPRALVGAGGHVVSLLVCLVFATALAHVQRYYAVRTLASAVLLGLLFILVPVGALVAQAWRSKARGPGFARQGLLMTAAVLCSVVLYVLQS
jgi:hypothetical protein